MVIHNAKISAHSYVKLHNCVALARPVQVTQFVTIVYLKSHALNTSLQCTKC